MDAGQWDFLSPMYICKINLDGVTYRSAEHYYQSMKASDEKNRIWIREASTGYEAKERAHSLKSEALVKKSPEQKVETMRKAFIAKFKQNPDLAEKLLSTKDAELLEDSPDDAFWGAKGENWIGKLAMEAREAVSPKK